jgi:hypothetical protein
LLLQIVYICILLQALLHSIKGIQSILFQIGYIQIF